MGRWPHHQWPILVLFILWTLTKPTKQHFVLFVDFAISQRRTYTQKSCPRYASNYSHFHEVYPLFCIDDFLAYGCESKRLSPRNEQRWTRHAMLSGSSKIAKHHSPFSEGEGTTSSASDHWCLVDDRRRWWYDGLGVIWRTFDLSWLRRTRQLHILRSYILPFTWKFSFFAIQHNHHPWYELLLALKQRNFSMSLPVKRGAPMIRR